MIEITVTGPETSAATDFYLQLIVPSLPPSAHAELLAIAQGVINNYTEGTGVYAYGDSLNTSDVIPLDPPPTMLPDTVYHVELLTLDDGAPLFTLAVREVDAEPNATVIGSGDWLINIIKRAYHEGCTYL